MKSRKIQHWLFLAILIINCSCSQGVSMKPDFDLALQKHFEAISNRDLDAFQSHMTKNQTLYTIVQNGHAFTTPEETIAIHKEWFKDHNWISESEVVHKLVGTDMAMAVVKYKYRANAKDAGFETWLTYVFALENGEWKIVHDQNTALDFAAFSKAMNQNQDKK